MKAVEERIEKSVEKALKDLDGKAEKVLEKLESVSQVKGEQVKD